MANMKCPIHGTDIEIDSVCADCFAENPPPEIYICEDCGAKSDGPICPSCWEDREMDSDD
jgi:hypothetical protein